MCFSAVVCTSDHRCYQTQCECTQVVCLCMSCPGLNMAARSVFQDGVVPTLRAFTTVDCVASNSCRRMMATSLLGNCLPVQAGEWKPVGALTWCNTRASVDSTNNAFAWWASGTGKASHFQKREVPPHSTHASSHRSTPIASAAHPAPTPRATKPRTAPTKHTTLNRPDHVAHSPTSRRATTRRLP